MEDRDKERAEVFDALGHPTRISILKLLSHQALSFADLKKGTDIASSGHLQHHLIKLDGLIRTDEHGNYRLSDAGNDALFAMHTVEAASGEGRRRAASYSRKSRVLLSVAVLALAACLIASTFYLSSINSSANQYIAQMVTGAQNQYVNVTQQVSQYFAQFAAQTRYAAQNQYVCNVMTGSLSEGGHERIGPSLWFDLSPQEWFNYTAMVFSELDRPYMGYDLRNCGTVDFPLPERNDTYYKQGFLVYDISVNGPVTDLVNASMYPIVGPDSWNRQVVWPHWQGIPPYRTAPTSKESTPLMSGGAPYHFTSIIPIDTFGNYTFSLRNEGNSTIQVSFKVTTPVVIFETKPLQEESYPAWSPDYAEERVVQIRRQSEFTPPAPPTLPTLSLSLPDTTTAGFNATTLAILSTIILAALSVFIVNRRKA